MEWSILSRRSTWSSHHLALSRAALLGHATRAIPEHYASADVERLISLANRVLDRVGTMTILRVANG
jgi:hypothetical protein